MQDYRKSYDNKRVSLTLTPRQYADFEKLATKEEIGVATLIKNMALAFYQSETYVPAEIENQLKDLNLLVRSIANNVNQVAHKANLDQTVDVNEVLAYIKQLESVIKDHTESKLQGK